ncbi:MAG: ECF transporter S component [Bacteroidetes bacterium]|jgi:energy-coupling factor transport system substrate-specific component|nr:ECF transporter S component [Bacteroidota bacterium]MCL5267072.1 ECF transporter S component [Bacteroidota bacterium]
MAEKVSVLEREVNATTIPLIAFGVALNIVVGQAVQLIKLPLYLDSIGTILIACIVGPLAGMLTGAFANLTLGLFFNYAFIFFIPVTLVIGAFSGVVARIGVFKRWYSALPAGLIQGVLSAVASAPISALMFGGVTMGGTDFLVLYFRAIGKSIIQSAFLQGLAADPVDKAVSYLIVYFLLTRIPRSILLRLPGYANT